MALSSRDTVASLGISGIELPFAIPMNDGGIRVFRQALALDERRAKFTPNFKLTESGTKAATDLDEATSSRPSGAQERGEGEALLSNRCREVWFAGCHCDVGGGSVLNTTRHSLARIPLRWMIRECFRMNTGIIFDKEMLFGIGFGAMPCCTGAEIHFRPSIVDQPDDMTERNQGTSLYRSLRDSIVALLWKPVEYLSLFFYTLFLVFCALLRPPVNHVMCPFNLIRYTKWFKSYFLAPERTAESDLEEGPTPDANEADEELRDALFPTYDQLSINWFWWIFEIWPAIFRLQDSKDSRQELETRVNLGRGRKIYGDAWNSFKKSGEKRWYIEVHRSVYTRMEAEDGERYRPRAWFRIHGEADFHWKGQHLADVENGGLIRWVE